MTRASTLDDLVIVEMDYDALTEDDIVALNTFNNVLGAEAMPEDPPEPLETTRADALNIPSFLVFHEFWARDSDGAIVGQAWSSWRNTEQNRHAANIRVLVRRERRRQGLGKALLDLVIPPVVADGRRLVIGWTTDRVPAGEAFARCVGADPAAAVHTNRLLLASVDRDLVRSWVDDGPRRASAYELVAVDGRYPNELVQQVADVYGVMNTAPRDDLDLEDEVHTVDQIREHEKRHDAVGTQRWSLFARHVASGELVGLTEVYWNPDHPETVYQGDTGVHLDHRGHALGKWLKAAMLERIFVDRPDALDVRTGNADSNDAMLGINRALGFAPYIAQMTWQMPVDRIQVYLAERS